MTAQHCCTNLAHGSANDRRQTLMMLFGAGLAGAALTSPRAALARAVEASPVADDEVFMRMALAQAAKGDLPFGAVIVGDKKVISTGRNIGKSTNDPTAHGEMEAIRGFIAKNPASELQGKTLYTSGEPCPMCMGAIIWCGISRVVFAASIDQLATKIGQIMIPCRTIAEATPFASITITGGVLATEALALFSK